MRNVNAFALSTAVVFQSATASQQSAVRPNILLITVDDLKPDLGCYGNRFVKTPNIDRLAGQGTVFLNNYCQQAVCAPSRMSMFTGLRPDSTRVTDLQTDLRTVLPNALTLQEYFKNNGYETMGCGKVMHGSKDEDPPSWSVPFMHDEDLPYVYGRPVPADLQYQSPEIHKAFAQVEKENIKGWKKKKDRLAELNARPATECLEVLDRAYADGAMTHWAVEQIWRRTREKPFFLTVGFHKPHLPFVAPKKYWDLYNRAEIKPSPVQVPPQGAPAYAGHTWGEMRAYSDIPQLGNLPIERHPELIHGYYACVSYIDEQVGRLLDTLRETGVLNNTIIILWGDHGWHLGDHGWWCKHTNYEQSTKAPLIISAPGFPMSRKTESMTEFVDVFPTVCELAGLPIPGKSEGKSLAPLLRDPMQTVKEFSVSQFPRGDKTGYAFRTPTHRMVLWMKNGWNSKQPFDESLIDAKELYDYNRDPLETVSLHSDPASRDTLNYLLRLAAGFFAEQEKTK